MSFKPFYTVFTVVNGEAYVICQLPNGEFTVENNPPGDIVLKIYDEDVAKSVAENNTKNGITYKYKLVK